jgi:hypothetical protein
MGMDFGWWNKDPEQGKYQVHARFHGGNIAWERKQGHHASWEKHAPSDEDWDQLFHEAGKRVPRRLISPKQFEELRKAAAGDGYDFPKA